MLLYSLTTLNVIKELDMIKSPELPGGGDFYGVDPHTGYLCGGHIQTNPGDDNVWEYVYDPVTETYVTINDNFGAAAGTDLLADDAAYTFLRHPTSGLQAVVSTDTVSVRVHSFPGLVYQTRWDVTHPTQAGWAKATVVDAPTDTAYLLTNRTSTSVEVFRLTIDVAGTVTRTSIGTYGESDFPAAVTTILNLSDRPIPHYDAATDSLTIEHNTDPGFVSYVLNYGVTTQEVNWVTEVDWAGNSFGWPRYYTRLAGGYWGFYGSTGFTYTVVNLVTGVAENRWGHELFIAFNSAFWDDTTDTFYAMSPSATFHKMLKTKYVTVTIAPGTLELFLSLPFPIEAGDLFTLYPGCDKSRITCAAVFDNVTKMLGAPDVPGQDALFSYPDVK
jgi:hypothetical protein